MDSGGKSSQIIHMFINFRLVWIKSWALFANIYKAFVMCVLSENKNDSIVFTIKQ